MRFERERQAVVTWLEDSDTVFEKRHGVEPSATFRQTEEGVMPGVKVDEIHGGNPDAGKDASLYQRLGGAYAIAGAVDYLIDRLHTNMTLNLNKGVEDFHAEQYKAGYKFMVTAWSIEKCGGPKCYIGSDMLEAHKHLKLSDYDFDVTAHEIRNTLYQLAVPRQEIEDFMDIIESYRSQIVHAD